MAGPIEGWVIVDALPWPLLVLGSDQVVLAANASGISTFTHGTAAPMGKNFNDVAAERWRVPLGKAIDGVIREGHPRTVLSMSSPSDASADPSEAVVRPLRLADGSLAGVLLT